MLNMRETSNLVACGSVDPAGPWVWALETGLPVSVR